jgi:hypothetical protein
VRCVLINATALPLLRNDAPSIDADLAEDDSREQELMLLLQFSAIAPVTDHTSDLP